VIKFHPAIYSKFPIAVWLGWNGLCDECSSKFLPGMKNFMALCREVSTLFCLRMLSSCFFKMMIYLECVIC